MRTAAVVIALALATAGCGKVDPIQQAADAAADEAAQAPPVSPDAFDPNKLRVTIKRCPVATCKSSSTNYVTVQVTVKQKDGSPPVTGYGVFMTFNRPGQKPAEEPAGCSDVNANDPEVERGIYRCLGIVGGPGTWEFSAALFRPGAENQPPITTVETKVEVSDAVTLKGEPKVP
ncbi:MAG: hypothetical protein ACT4QF_17720 [Sporichthyaceae bacterium]